MELYRTKNERAIGVKNENARILIRGVGEEEFAMCPELTPIVSPDLKEFVTATPDGLVSTGCSNPIKHTLITELIGIG